jgi:hypothetical protein
MPENAEQIEQMAMDIADNDERGRNTEKNRLGRKEGGRVRADLLDNAPGETGESELDLGRGHANGVEAKARNKGLKISSVEGTGCGGFHEQGGKWR